MPETLRGLWRQRLRWAEGGGQMLLDNAGPMLRGNTPSLLPVYLDAVTSIVWLYCVLATLLLAALHGIGIRVLPTIPTFSLVPEWYGLTLCLTFLLQALVSTSLETRLERGLRGTLLRIIWYPLAFWTLNAFTAVLAIAGADAVCTREPPGSARTGGCGDGRAERRSPPLITDAQLAPGCVARPADDFGAAAAAGFPVPARASPDCRRNGQAFRPRSAFARPELVRLGAAAASLCGDRRGSRRLACRLGSVSLRRLRQSAHLPAPPDLSPAEEARNAGCSEEDLTDWRQPKIAVADLDPAGRVVVRPCPIKVADAPAILRTAPTLVSAEAEGLG